MINLLINYSGLIYTAISVAAAIYLFYSLDPEELRAEAFKSDNLQDREMYLGLANDMDSLSHNALLPRWVFPTIIIFLGFLWPMLLLDYLDIDIIKRKEVGNEKH